MYGSSPIEDISGFLPWEDVLNLIEAAENPRDRLLITTLALSGRRVSEVLQLKPVDVLKDSGKVVFPILKKKNKELKKAKKIPERLYNFLKMYIESKKIPREGYIFESRMKTGHPITRQRVFQIVRKLGEKIGIEKVGKKYIHPHHFRHSFAVHMLKKAEKPGDLRRLQMYLEHSSLMITEKYLQLATTDEDELINRVF